MAVLDANGNPIPFDSIGECDNCGSKVSEIASIGVYWLCETCAAPVVAELLKRAARQEEI